MSTFKKGPVSGARSRKDAPVRKDPLASLRVAEMLSSKPFLPAEILSLIADHLPVQDLLRFARVSKRMQEMVYDDSRWIQRLRKMGCWNEIEARKLAEATNPSPSPDSPVFRRQSVGRGFASNVQIPQSPTKSAGRGLPHQATQVKRKSSIVPNIADGFDAVTLSPPNASQNTDAQKRPDDLHVLEHVKSIRGQSRQEYGKAYRALAPFYTDIAESRATSNYRVFKTYSSPEDQAQMLHQLAIFAMSDLTQGATTRQLCLENAISAFETAALNEFRLGYEAQDAEGSARKYGRVLSTLNGGQSAVEFFLHHNKLVAQKDTLGLPSDAVDYSTGRGVVSLERTQSFFNHLTVACQEEYGMLEKMFPNPGQVALMFFEKVGKDILSPYLTALFDEAHDRSVENYLAIVPGTFAQTVRLTSDLPSIDTSPEVSLHTVKQVLTQIYQPHLELYLKDELESFKSKSESQINEWDRALSEQASSTEMFLMSNINRQADKKDFLTSFKKVVMMPVNILPNMSSNKGTAKALVNGEAVPSQNPLRRADLSSNPVSRSGSSTPIPQEAPSTELAAKVAIMNSKLEGIRTLFSIEVALTLVHTAKQSLERIAQFVQMLAPVGPIAQAQCGAIFMTLLDILGTRHVKVGFDKAVSHLSSYNPRSLPADHPPDSTVHPLGTFLELVNVGDLIQQMLDVFYEQELIAAGLTDRSDFLDPTNKSKKAFEQMLDERVAAGLNKGIDVLIDEIDYLFATTQLPTDYNPPPPSAGDPTPLLDVGQTPTSTQILSLLSTHLSLLPGTADKTLLDVFSTELALRLFHSLCKHLKRQRISTTGSLRLIADINAYYSYIATLKNPDLLLYFRALRELTNVYIIEGKDVKGIAEVVADVERWRGVFRPEEVLEFAERRADWLAIRRGVEGAMYGQGCRVM
ncbi:MAG: hypothetical protein Q9227_007962 [Pyrenula ochraceoflavens]